MPGSVPNVSRDSFDFTKAYQKLSLQQGVPIMDSDWNEALDNVWVRGIHLLNHAFIGNCRFPVVQPDGTETANSGFLIKQSSSSTTNNFTITAGYACCYGAVVGSTAAMPPADVEYDDQEMFAGTISSLAGADIIDTSKAFSASHDLVDCRVKMTSGTASGTAFKITAVVSGTRLTLDSPSGIAPGDTYVIIPEALTTPSGGNRTDDVYLMVYFEDIDEAEDTDVEHPGTGIASVHKTKIRGVVRVGENSGYTNSTAVGSLANYAVRTMKIAELARLDGNATILTAMITEEDNVRSSLADLAASDIPFTTTTMVSTGYSGITGNENIQAAIDQIISDLADDTDPAVGANLIGVYDVADSPESITAGTLFSTLTALLGHINDRVETINPTAAPTSPVLVWRSHGHTSDATVDEDVTSIYVLPASSLSTDGHALAFCNGCYLDGANAYASLGTPGSATMFLISGSGFQQLTREAPSGSWAWDNSFNWNGSIIASGGASNKVTMFDTALLLGVRGMSYGSTLPITLTPDTDGVDHSCEVYIKGDTPFSITNPLKFFVMEDGLQEPGIFYNSDGLWLTINAKWDDATYKWVPGSAADDAHAINIRDTGVWFLHKSSSTAGFATGWSILTWDASHQIGSAAPGTDFHSGITSSGDTLELLQFRQGFIQDFATTSETISTILYCGENYRARWAVAPTSYSITVTAENNLAAIAGVVVVAANQWGLHYNIDFDGYTSDAGTTNFVEGYFTVQP